MFNLCICGSSHLHTDDEDDMDASLSPCSSPKGSKKKATFNNPYANRGLDKFSALLADLQGMKQRIYTQIGSDQISFIRFAFSSNSDCVKPIVVKSKKKEKKKKRGAIYGDRATKDGLETQVIRSASEVQETGGGWKKPRYYLPLVIILVLGFLVVYGRSFAIMCASIGWYVIPAIGESSKPSMSSSRKKKGYARKFGSV